MPKRFCRATAVGLCHWDTVVSKEGSSDEFLERLCFCFQTSRIKEGTIKAISDVLSLLQIWDSVWEHAGEEQLLHSISKHKRGWCISTGEDLMLHSIRQELDDVEKFPWAAISLKHCPEGFWAFLLTVLKILIRSVKTSYRFMFCSIHFVLNLSHCKKYVYGTVSWSKTTLHFRLVLFWYSNESVQNDVNKNLACYR